MRWSLPIGTVLGIRLRLHWTFLIFLVGFGALEGAETGWLGALELIGAMLIIFLCVLLHELGHSVAAIRYGVSVNSITLLPIGGVASMGSIPENSLQEFVIAIAGPMVNVVIAVLFSVWTRWWPSLHQIFMARDFPADLSIPRLVQFINIWLVVFNALPAFPMDGGRVFRALLASFMSYGRATFIASLVGRWIAVMMVFSGPVFEHFGLRWSPLLPLIGVFIFFGAAQENRWVKLRARLRGRIVAEIMHPIAAVVGPRDPLSHILAIIHRIPQIDFPVLDEGQLVGLLPREAWMRASRMRLDDPPVHEIMVTHFVTVRSQLEIARLLYDRKMLKQTFFPVVEDGRLIGYVTRADLDAALNPPAPPPLPQSAPPPRGLTIDMG